MSIQKTRAYVTTDGQTHATLELAQKAELVRLLQEPGEQPGLKLNAEEASTLAGQLVARREEFIAILCASGRKPRTTKKGSGKRKGKAETAAV